jgi:hypothetical protein
LFYFASSGGGSHSKDYYHLNKTFVVALMQTGHQIALAYKLQHVQPIPSNDTRRFTVSLTLKNASHKATQ